MSNAALPWRSYSRIVLAAAAWGAGTVLLKRSLDDVSPFSLNAMMLAGSVALLWALVFLQRLPVHYGPDLRRVGALGLIHPGLVLTLGTLGLDRISASMGAIIQASQPAMIILLAWLLLRQRPSRSLLLLTAAAATGVVLVIGVENSADGKTINGSLLMIAAAALASLVLVLISRLIGRVDPLVAVSAQQTVGLSWALVVLAIEALARGRFDPGLSSPAAWGWALASGMTFFGLGFWLYYRGLRAIPAAVAAPFLSLIPVFATLGGILFLHERLAVQQWFGLALILFAVTTIARLRRTVKRAA